MPQNETATNQPSPKDIYAQNRATLLGLLQGPGDSLPADAEAPLTLTLERVLVDRTQGALVPFAGEAGIEALLEALARVLPQATLTSHDGHAMELEGTIPANDKTLPLNLSLGAGGQLCCAVGPTTCVQDAWDALEAFDRQVHVIGHSWGADLELLGEGYNPLAASPLDVPLVPWTRWTLLNAHLGQTGRYARDAMRCACATRISLQHAGGRAGREAYRMAVALSPLLSFLTDNIRTFRDADARHTQAMMHVAMWDEVDPTRCGVVPHTFDADFGYAHYLDWLEGIQPILLTTDDGTVTSTGKSLAADVLSERLLSQAQAAELLGMVFPYVRLGQGTMELVAADALRPRMAAGYMAFVKGLLGNALAVDAVSSLLGPLTDKDVAQAASSLRAQGWDATVYGKSAGQLTDELLRIARSSLPADEVRTMDNIAEEWEVRMVPRDAFVHQEVKAVRGW